MAKTEKNRDVLEYLVVFSVFQFYMVTFFELYIHLYAHIYIHTYIYINIHVPGSRHPSPAMVITTPPILCFPSLLLVEWLGAGLIYKGETTVYGESKKDMGIPHERYHRGRGVANREPGSYMVPPK